MAVEAIAPGYQFLSLPACYALSALKYFGPNIRDTEHKAYLSPFPYDVL